MMISGEARVAGVMGWPVSHSLSPRLHNYWLDKHGIDGAFIPLPVPPEHFPQALRVCAHMGFRGVNATVPHKEAALATVDVADKSARRIGAVNTVVVQEDGSLLGMNTDGVGFLSHLRATHPSFQPDAGPAVVVGAGGAARAAAFALIDAGASEVRVVNRTLARAETLARALGPAAKVVSWIDRAGTLADAHLLVNTTTQGMRGQPRLDLDLACLPPDAFVYDIVYTPLKTPLLAEAERRGNATVDGLGMLLHQAVPCFEAWFGVRPEVTEELRAFVAAGLG